MFEQSDGNGGFIERYNSAFYCSGAESFSGTQTWVLVIFHGAERRIAKEK